MVDAIMADRIRQYCTSWFFDLKFMEYGLSLLQNIKFTSQGITFSPIPSAVVTDGAGSRAQGGFVYLRVWGTDSTLNYQVEGNTLTIVKDSNVGIYAGFTGDAHGRMGSYRLNLQNPDHWLLVAPIPDANDFDKAASETVLIMMMFLIFGAKCRNISRLATFFAVRYAAHEFLAMHTRNVKSSSIVPHTTHARCYLVTWTLSPG
jgi:hypothetical protein